MEFMQNQPQELSLAVVRDRGVLLLIIAQVFSKGGAEGWGSW